MGALRIPEHTAAFELCVCEAERAQEGERVRNSSAVRKLSCSKIMVSLQTRTNLFYIIVVLTTQQCRFSAGS